MDKERLWTKDFLIDATVNFAFYLVYYMLWVVIGEHAIDRLGAAPSVAGSLSGIFIIGGFVARLATGKYIETVGPKKMLVCGIVFYIAMTFAYLATANVGLLILVRLFHGLGFGMTATATGTIVAKITPRSRHGEGISYYALSVTLASAVGPIVGMFIYEKGGLAWVVIAAAIALAVSLALAARLSSVPSAPPPAAATGGERDAPRGLFSIFEESTLPIGAVSVLIALSFSSTISFIAPYSREIGLPAAGKFFFVVYSIFIVASRPITGKLFDKKGMNFVMYPVFVVFALGIFLMAIARADAVLLVAAALVGVGYGTYMSCAQVIAVRLAPSSRVGLATSTFFGIADLGMGVGPVLWGALIPIIDYRGVYLAVALTIATSMVLYHVLCGRTAKI